MTSAKQKQMFAGVLENKGFKIFCKTREKIPTPECLFNKVLGFRPEALLGKYSDTGFFISILQNFSELLFFVKHPWRLPLRMYLFYEMILLKQEINTRHQCFIFYYCKLIFWLNNSNFSFLKWNFFINVVFYWFHVTEPFLSNFYFPQQDTNNINISLNPKEICKWKRFKEN